MYFYDYFCVCLCQTKLDYARLPDMLEVYRLGRSFKSSRSHQLVIPAGHNLMYANGTNFLMILPKLSKTK